MIPFGSEQRQNAAVLIFSLTTLNQILPVVNVLPITHVNKAAAYTR